MNTRNTSIKRILADVRELKKHPSSRYSASPLENNMFEWHFTIRGPVGSDFESGMYHGRILLPADYPFKPPNIVFVTKNGRFEVGTKICLSISAYHEETWQPAWGIRTMLEAIISFLPSEGAGAIGALDWTKEERQKLAKESLNFCCSLCGPIRDLLSDFDGEEPDKDICSQVDQLSLRAGNLESPRPNPSIVSKEEKPETLDPTRDSQTRVDLSTSHLTSVNSVPVSTSSPTISTNITSITTPALLSDNHEIHLHEKKTSCSLPPSLPLLSPVAVSVIEDKHPDSEQDKKAQNADPSQAQDPQGGPAPHPLHPIEPVATFDLVDSLLTILLNLLLSALGLVVFRHLVRYIFDED